MPKLTPLSGSGATMVDASLYQGKCVTQVILRTEKLVLIFDDGSKIAIFDDLDLCCERRYWSTDDDVASLLGHRIQRIEEKPGPMEENGGVHETCFVEIGTEVGCITLTSHNVHNGYYGGFALRIREI